MVESSHPKPIRIPVHKLLYKPNAVSGMNYLVIGSLVYFYRSGVLDADPIHVFPEGDNYRIMDGRHRSVSSMIAGRPDVLGIVEEFEGQMESIQMSKE